MFTLAGPPASQRSGLRTRRRMSRTFSRARWKEYEALLQYALASGYRIRPVEEHFLQPSDDDPVLLLRHDLDQAPGSALAMSRVEQRLGVRSSWYTRWRTSDAALLRELHLRGGTIGLHYETLSRLVLEAGAGCVVDDRLLDTARATLQSEIAEYGFLFGSVRSVCAHGDTRVPGLRNFVLMDGRSLAEFGIELDLDHALRTTRLGAWLTDRSRAEGGWKPGLDPTQLISEQVSPLLCITHPNNWISGRSLWQDRILAAGLPEPGGRPMRVLRTVGDAPRSAVAGDAV